MHGTQLARLPPQRSEGRAIAGCASEARTPVPRPGGRPRARRNRRGSPCYSLLSLLTLRDTFCCLALLESFHAARASALLATTRNSSRAEFRADRATGERSGARAR